MSKYDRLREYLERAGDRVDLDFETLDELVGGLPESARRHAAWWANGATARSQGLAWVAAGYRARPNLTAERVVFERAAPRTRVPRTTSAKESRSDPMQRVGVPDVVLVSCSKLKLEHPAPAKELYVSPLFRAGRAAAEATGQPWFILSAEHGLVDPDQLLEPYDFRLSDQTQAYKSAWGAWVVEKLQARLGEIRGKTVEIHAGASYVDPIRPQLESAGAEVEEPAHGLSMGKRLQHYALESSVLLQNDDLVAALTDPTRPVSARDVASLRATIEGHPGLYSWWVDESGARDLSSGLGIEISSGVIYAGQAGASTKGDLWSRLTSMHLGKKAKMSTFRLTLGSILAGPLGWDGPDDPRLSDWMERHLSVIALPIDDRASILRHEKAVLKSIDPPLNLKDVERTEVRVRLGELRKAARTLKP